MSDKLPEKYPPLEYYIERAKMIEQQLAEARAALAEIEPHLSLYGDEGRWQAKYATVLKAAREAQ